MAQLTVPVDANRRQINAARRIEGVINTSVTTSAYAAITVPTGMSCKRIVCKQRLGGNFLVGTTSSPTNYITVVGTLTLDIIGEAGDILFYVKGAAADTFEVLLLN